MNTFNEETKIPSVLLRIVKEMESDIIRLHDKEVIRKIKEEMKPRDTNKISFYHALAIRKSPLCPNLIAEVKYTSPSNVRKGNPDFITNVSPEEIAKKYTAHGASAISVLTHKDFKGKLEYLKRVKEVTDLPVLRKDFITDENQIYEARYYGADAILLISAILDVQKMKDFIGIAKKLRMDCLVESHNKEELKKAIAAGAKIYGINNRNLHTFEINLNTTLDLINEIPKDSLIVTESGILTYEDVKKLSHPRINAMLVGTTLVKTNYVKGKIDELLGK